MEIWTTIDEFPQYKVNDYGNIINVDTNKNIRQSLTKTGLVKVGLVRSGVQYTRSVANIVAEAFVEGKNDIFDTPIHLDGDKTNNAAYNLMWRPRWFAWKYTRQLSVESVHHERGPIIDVDTGKVYQTFLEAAMTHGLLIEDIWKCLIHKKRVFPTDQMFKIVN